MERIESLYKNRGYFERYGTDVVIAFLLIAITVGINSYSTYTSILSQVKANWNDHRCNPIYMPFAGLIVPQPGQSTSETTSQNFQYCIQQNTSTAINIALMPFEFAMFIVIEFLDSVMASITAFMELIQWLKNQLGGIFTQLYQKILLFIIPLMEMIIHLRDMFAKINGVMITALYSVMDIYNITVSGILNVMVVLDHILIITIAILLALLVLAFALMPTPAFALGFGLYASGMALLGSFVVPVIVMYTVMEVFTTTLFKTLSPKAPKTPSVKKKK
jgi:hypothetical protein